MNKNNKSLPSNLENVDDHGGEVTEEEDHDDTEQHAGQSQLPHLGPTRIGGVGQLFTFNVNFKSRLFPPNISSPINHGLLLLLKVKK